MTEDYSETLAVWYDELIDQRDPDAWADFLTALDQRHRQGSPRGDGTSGRPLLLDLGCGTGSVTLALEARGYDVIGVDRSGAMLAAAREKGLASGSRALWLKQDITQFELYGTVDLIVSTLDTVNHLLKKRDVKDFLKLCFHYLNPGRCLIFDVLTRHCLARTRGDQTFYRELVKDEAAAPELALVWQNDWQRRSNLSRASLIGYIREADGRYWRFEEEITERHHELGWLRRQAEQQGFEWLENTAELRHRRPRKKADRTFMILRKPDLPGEVEPKDSMAVQAADASDATKTTKDEAEHDNQS